MVYEWTPSGSLDQLTMPCRRRIVVVCWTRACRLCRDSLEPVKQQTRGCKT